MVTGIRYITGIMIIEEKMEVAVSYLEFLLSGCSGSYSIEHHKDGSYKGSTYFMGIGKMVTIDVLGKSYNEVVERLIFKFLERRIMINDNLDKGIVVFD